MDYVHRATTPVSDVANTPVVRFLRPIALRKAALDGVEEIPHLARAVADSFDGGAQRFLAAGELLRPEGDLPIFLQVDAPVAWRLLDHVPHDIDCSAAVPPSARCRWSTRRRRRSRSRWSRTRRCCAFPTRSCATSSRPTSASPRASTARYACSSPIACGRPRNAWATASRPRT